MTFFGLITFLKLLGGRVDFLDILWLSYLANHYPQEMKVKTMGKYLYCYIVNTDDDNNGRMIIKVMIMINTVFTYCL